MERIIGKDQYGFEYPIKGKHPRKELMEHFGVKHAEKMYIDTKEGKSLHIGYVISGHWITLYKLTRIEKEL